MAKVVRALAVAAIFSAGVLAFSGCQVSVPNQPSTLKDEPQVTFKDLEGKDVPLASFKGKVVLLNFWGTWCEPCRHEIPILIGLQEKYASRGFTLIGAATMDDEKAVDQFIHTTEFNVDGKQTLMDYPIVMNTDDISTKFGGLLGMPTSYLITRDGKIYKRWNGALDPLEAEVVKDVESLL